eukprot:1308699-Rhodomonas_salina.2
MGGVDPDGVVLDSVEMDVSDVDTHMSDVDVHLSDADVCVLALSILDAGSWVGVLRLECMSTMPFCDVLSARGSGIRCSVKGVAPWSDPAAHYRSPLLRRRSPRRHPLCRRYLQSESLGSRV